MSRKFLAALTALSLAATGPVAAQPVNGNWDGLIEVDAKKLDKVYLLPEADFSGYTKVMIDPTVVAFRKNWQRDQNRDSSSLSGQVSDRDARRILDQAQESFQELFAREYAKAGFQVVTEAGPDVLRLSTAIANLDVVAPDVNSSARSRTYSEEAGQATLVLEVKDSLTGAVLGRAVDHRITSSNGPYIRNRVTNIADFEQLFARWASTSADGLTELKGLSPVNTTELQAGR